MRRAAEARPTGSGQKASAVALARPESAGRCGTGGAATAGIIALDLDGTLLNSNKELTPGNVDALQKAAEAGYEIVPTTGRFFGAMPEEIRSLPFIRYAITINGAQVEDLRTGEIIFRAEIPWEQAAEIMAYLDEKAVIYDCYMDNKGWMSEAMKEEMPEVVEDPHYRQLIYSHRQSVPELKAFLADYCPAHGVDVQKIQLFVKYPELKPEIMGELPQRFEHIAVSSAIIQNIEINQSHANKGEALLALADYLGVPRESTYAFGDGLNDLSMIREAGVGIVMENAFPELKAEADWIT